MLLKVCLCCLLRADLGTAEGCDNKQSAGRKSQRGRSQIRGATSASISAAGCVFLLLSQAEINLRFFRGVGRVFFSIHFEPLEYAQLSSALLILTNFLSCVMIQTFPCWSSLSLSIFSHFYQKHLKHFHGFMSPTWHQSLQCIPGWATLNCYSVLLHIFSQNTIKTTFTDRLYFKK